MVQARLHWFKETALFAGSYAATNSFFVERIAALKTFKSSTPDKALKAVALYPLIERDGDETDAVAKPVQATAGLSPIRKCARV